MIPIENHPRWVPIAEEITPTANVCNYIYSAWDNGVHVDYRHDYLLPNDREEYPTIELAKKAKKKYDSVRRRNNWSSISYSRKRKK